MHPSREPYYAGLREEVVTMDWDDTNRNAHTPLPINSELNLDDFDATSLEGYGDADLGGLFESQEEGHPPDVTVTQTSDERNRPEKKSLLLN